MLIFSSLAFLLSLAFCPIIIALCRRFNWYDEVDPRKIHTGQIPRLGGVALFAAFLLAFIVYCLFLHPLDLKSTFPLLLGGILILGFGITDDFINMRAKIKFLVQIVAALIVVLGPNYFDHVLFLQLPPVLGKALTFFWIIGIVNAFNLIDGMDWLCSGLSLFAILTLGFILYLGEKDICALHFILSGAILGFMFWNRPNARIFLGDGGSQSLGYIIAVSPFFYTDMHHFQLTQFPIMILLCSIPINDVIAAIWRRKREHRSFFSPDRGHIHHKLLNIGFTKGTAIFFLLALQFLICFVTIATCFMDPFSSIILLLVAFSFVIMFFVVIHYLNLSVNLRHTGHLEDHPQAEH